MQRIKFKMGKTFDINHIIDFGAEYEIEFAKGTNLQEVLSVYSDVDNPEFNSAAIRQFDLYNLIPTINNEAEGEILVEELQSTHTGYTILKKTTLNRENITILLQKEIEVVTDVNMLKIKSDQLSEYTQSQQIDVEALFEATNFVDAKATDTMSNVGLLSQAIVEIHNRLLKLEGSNAGEQSEIMSAVLALVNR